MREARIEVAGRDVITARLDPTNVHGRDIMGTPALHLPLEFQLLPREGNEPEYTVVRIEGSLMTAQRAEFARFDPGPLALVPGPRPYYHQQQATAKMDRLRVKRFEDLRNGGDARFIASISCLVWLPAQRQFQVTYPVELEVRVPKSHWAESVVAAWGLSEIKVIEISFPKNATGENFRASHSRICEAESQFANAQYKQVLTTLRLSFEGLAKNLGFSAAGKDFFDSLFSSAYAEKREKAREALLGLYRFLHLGPHEQADLPGATAQPVITRQDARFALTLAHAIFEYIAPES